MRRTMHLSAGEWPKIVEAMQLLSTRNAGPAWGKGAGELACVDVAVERHGDGAFDLDLSFGTAAEVPYAGRFPEADWSVLEPSEPLAG